MVRLHLTGVLHYRCGVVASPDAPSEGLALALILADAEGSALVLGAAEG